VEFQGHAEFEVHKMRTSVPVTGNIRRVREVLSQSAELGSQVRVPPGGLQNGAPLVSIVIPNRNGMDVLPNCLDSLMRQRYPNVEILLVDNASNDGSDGFVRRNYQSVRVISKDENLGYGGGCNLGATEAAGDYVLFLANDTSVAPNFLEELVRVAIRDSRIGIIQNKLLRADNPLRIDSVGSYFTSTGLLYYQDQGMPDSYHDGQVLDIFAADGTAMMVRTSLFEELGGFDEDYSIYYDDVDFSWRMWSAGYRVVVATRSVVYHKGSATTSRDNSERIVFIQFRNRLCTLIKNLSGKDIARVLPLHLITCVAGSLAFVLRGKPGLAGAILRGLLWNVLNLRITLEKRRVNRRVAKAAIGDLFPRLERPMPISELISSRIEYLNRWK